MLKHSGIYPKIPGEVKQPETLLMPSRELLAAQHTRRGEARLVNGRKQLEPTQTALTQQTALVRYMLEKVCHCYCTGGLRYAANRRPDSLVYA